MKKFNLDDKKYIHYYFQENGYVVIKNAIPKVSIDNFINEYEKIRHNRFFIYYSQSLHIAMRPILNRYSYIEESMQTLVDLSFLEILVKLSRNVCMIKIFPKRFHL